MSVKRLFVSTLFLSILLLSSCERSNQPTSDNLDEIIGQMIMIGFRGFDLSPDNPIVNDLVNNKICGVILFDYDVTLQKFERNISTPKQLQKLIMKVKQYSALKPFIAIDMEGGRVNRLKTNYGFPPTVSAQYLGTIDNIDSTKFYTDRIAKTLSDMGINLNLAPVVDVNINPENPVIGKIERSFSADPNIVVKHASEFINAHKSYNILTSLKHFPGHGSSKGDSHHGFTDVTDTWQSIELEPYSGLLTTKKVDIIMTAHIFNARFDSVYPATLSYNTITKILRDSLKFSGVVISDDMQMKAITDNYGLETAIEKGINAGVDILLFANNLVYDPEIFSKSKSIILKLLSEGKITRERLYESYNRIKTLKLSLLN